MIYQSADEIEYISFKKIEKWDKYSGFVYDFITDKQIEFATEILKQYPEIKQNLNIDVNFLDDKHMENYKTEQELIFMHSCRISILIDIAKNNSLIPVVFDTIANVVDNYSGVLDGHHRIRALQYLKRLIFPAYCSGYVDEIDSITI